MINIVRIFSLVALLCIPATVSQAFDGKEHTYISNFAFRIAAFRAINSAEAQKLTPEQALRLADTTSFIILSADLTYGDLVALVDGVKDMQPLFQSSRAFGYPREKADVDWEHLRELRKDFFRWAEAAHTNENHFQSGALIGHWLAHQEAVSLSSRGELLSALLVEAYADHFIEDFFAPGHVATPRSGFTDFASAASHDRYNHLGLSFTFNSQEELVHLVSSIITVMKDPAFYPPPPPRAQN